MKVPSPSGVVHTGSLHCRAYAKNNRQGQSQQGFISHLLQLTQQTSEVGDALRTSWGMLTGI